MTSIDNSTQASNNPPASKSMLLRLESRKMRCRVALKRLRRKGVSTFKASHYNLYVNSCTNSNYKVEWGRRMVA